MSWQDYVDKSLVGTQNIDKAAIFGIQGGGKWSGSAGFDIKPNEIAEIQSAFADKSDVKKVQSTGLHIAGDKYIVVKADDRSLYGSKGKTGVLIVRTTQAIIIGHYPETVPAGAAATVVENLADYLIKAKY